MRQATFSKCRDGGKSLPLRIGKLVLSSKKHLFLLKRRGHLINIWKPTAIFAFNRSLIYGGLSICSPRGATLTPNASRLSVTASAQPSAECWRASKSELKR